MSAVAHLVAFAPAGAAAAAVSARMPIVRTLRNASVAVQRASHVIRSPKISDHWKEKVLPAFSLVILSSSLRLGAILAALTGAFLAVYWGGGLAFAGSAPGLADVLQPVGLAIAALAAISYAAVTRRRP